MAVRTRAGALNFCTPLPGVGDSLLCPPPFPPWLHHAEFFSYSVKRKLRNQLWGFKNRCVCVCVFLKCSGL